MPDLRLVIFCGKVYEVLMPYSHHLELRGEDGKIIDVKYGDPDLINAPTLEDLAALQTPKKRTR